jgi:hypothetical protein
MAIAHYGYLVLKMPSPNNIIKICGDCSAGVFTLEKLQALAATHEVAAGQGASDWAPSSLCLRVSSSAPRMQPLDDEDVLVKVIQICRTPSSPITTAIKKALRWHHLRC